MATMKDVAEIAKVSVSTVSRVINNTLPVDAATRERVEIAIRIVDFHPNLVARGLRSKSGNLIGLVVPELQHESFTAFIKYTEESVEEHGFNLIIGNTNSDPDKEERFIRNLIRRHVDGVIFSRVSDESRIFRIIEESGVPFVVIDRSMEREDIPTVVMDNYRAGEIAATHLLEKGHREFACITGPMNIAIVRERFSGFRDTIVSGGGNLADENVAEGDFKFESGVKCAQRFARHQPKFTALWAQNDLMAIGAMNVFSNAGIGIPQQLSVVGLDNTTSSRMVVPALTTIAQPFQAMCKSAVEMILHIRAKETVTEWRVTHAPELIVRETTARRDSGRIDGSGSGTVQQL